ncbi:hypothetical protein CIB84_011923, partial [Bambusicola thoracicus]
VSVSDSGSMMKDSSVILEIPPATTIAYGVIELFIKRDGQFVKLPDFKEVSGDIMQKGEESSGLCGAGS